MPLLQASLRCEVGKSENNLENFAGSLKRPRGEYSKLTSDITSNIKKNGIPAQFRNHPSRNSYGEERSTTKSTKCRDILENRKLQREKENKVIWTSRHTQQVNLFYYTGYPKSPCSPRIKTEPRRMARNSESFSRTKISGSRLRTLGVQISREPSV
ncbi:hypothetical protein JTB14_031980 [Gonioctena quinquepunctata]|nr:hypothetical protein JTB14_031980 [Gonioctena quinquepunctata]